MVGRIPGTTTKHGDPRIKITLAAAAAVALAPVGALARHVDVGPGGVGVHGDGHRRDVDHTHTTVEENHRDRPVVHEHHDDHHDKTVVEVHRH